MVRSTSNSWSLSASMMKSGETFGNMQERCPTTSGRGTSESLPTYSDGSNTRSAVSTTFDEDLSEGTMLRFARLSSSSALKSRESESGRSYSSTDLSAVSMRPVSSPACFSSESYRDTDGDGGRHKWNGMWVQLRKRIRIS